MIKLVRLLTLSLLCVATATVAAETAFAPITITDSRGVEVVIDSPPKRIVSLSPSLTETLFAVEAGALVSGVTKYCNFPADALEIPKIGGFSAKSISIESIIALQPDIVFADNSRHGQIIETLETYGITVVSTNATSVADVYHVIELVGAAVGRHNEAVAVVDDMQKRIANVVAAASVVPADRKPLVFWEVFDEPLMTAGPSTFIGQLIDLAGGVNVFADVTESWPKISHEELLARNPAVLMSSDSHGEKFTADAIKARTGWAELSAVRNELIYLFDGDMVSRPGPRIADAVEAMAYALHPDLVR